MYVCPFRVARIGRFQVLAVLNELDIDSTKTMQMCRLIRVLIGRACQG